MVSIEEKLWMAHLLLAAIPITLLSVLVFALAPRKHDGQLHQHRQSDEGLLSPHDAPRRGTSRISQTADIHIWKQLYYKVQNLEDFPEMLPQARSFVRSLLGEASAAQRAALETRSILCLEHFSVKGLKEFIMLQDEETASEWDLYTNRRRMGGNRELFKDRDEAEWWLKQLAPVKLVDGAWLGHINRVTLPYGLLETVRSAWQVLSEELGDGQLERNHAYVYRKLLKSIEVDLPPCYELDFIHPRHGLDEASVWKAAVAQILICLFPHDLLPEILGFNMHFEAVSLETLMATKELKEIGLDPCYFMLHVSIDNGHSGHTAMATQIVCRYCEYVGETEGEEAQQRVWKRIQAGYLLSSAFPPTAVRASKPNESRKSPSVLSTTESDVINIFRAKAQVGHRIHCESRSRIGRRTVSDWLNPAALQSRQWQINFLDDLSNCRYWIQRGCSTRSRFVQEILWGGRMFGSFTDAECDAVKRWIDELPVYDDEGLIYDNGADADILSDYPVFQKQPATVAMERPEPVVLTTFDALEPLPILEDPIPEKLLPLWLTHTCLLQNFVSVPDRTTNTAVCAIIEILRAQAGLGTVGSCVAGMDEVLRPTSLGIIGLGLVLTKQWEYARPTSLKNVLKMWPSKFAMEMLHLSMRHLKNKGLLIGMATAFSQLHTAMSCSEILSAHDRNILSDIARREGQCLQICWKDLEFDPQQRVECCEGYRWARSEILKCFEKF